jgi:ABC-type bacteriocin/lantibiotic exporter with double-glycine peptidase domain
VKYPRSAYFAENIPIYGFFYRLMLWSFGPVKNHFIVVFGVRDGSFLVMDPAHGYTTIGRARLDKCWRAMGYSALLCAKRQ